MAEAERQRAEMTLRESEFRHHLADRKLSSGSVRDRPRRRRVAGNAEHSEHSRVRARATHHGDGQRRVMVSRFKALNRFVCANFLIFWGLCDQKAPFCR